MAEVSAVPGEASELSGVDKPKRKRKPKKKTHLDESFPNYLRVSKLIISLKEKKV